MSTNKKSPIFDIAIKTELNDENNLDEPEITSVVSETTIEDVPQVRKGRKRTRLINSERNFRFKWLRRPELRPWLVSAPEKPHYVKCKWCKVYLRAHLHDLKKHNECIKHRKQSLSYAICDQTSTKSDDELETSLSIEKESVFNRQKNESPPEGISDLNPARIGFIGCGSMAQSLLSGFLKNGLIDPASTIVSAPSNRNLRKLHPLGIKTVHNNMVVFEGSDIIFLCVKPHILPEVLNPLQLSRDAQSPLFVSVIGGLSIPQLEAMLSQVVLNPRVIRVIPNTPCMVAQGCCIFSCGSNVESGEASVVKCLLGALGLCEEIPETQLDAACGLAGSGPAYIYSVIESLADGAVKMGLPRTIALAIAAQTVKGAASMVLETGKHPGMLKDDVCSPGGTTITAMHLLEKGGLRGLMMSAVEVATIKSKELN